jgi:hypothetical protein
MCTCKLRFTHIVRRDPDCTLHGDRVQPDLFDSNSPTEPFDDFFDVLDDFYDALMRAQSFRHRRKAAETDLDSNLRPKEGRSL